MLYFIFIFVFGLFHCTLSAFIVGADISHIELFEKQGIHYRDYDNQPVDIFRLLKKHGINCVRLSLFTSSEKQVQENPYDFSPDLKEALRLARRAKQNNLQILLDFQYSDFWAGPGNQTKLSQWINMTFDQLKQQLYEYTRDTINTFIRQKTLPDYVQIGNEVSAGILWPDGNLRNWTKLGSLFRAASEGIRAATRQSKIIVHITHADTWSTTKWLLDHIIFEEHVDFDIIGESYYPFLDGPLDDVRNCLHRMVERYQKPIIIAETAFPWTQEDPPNRSVKNTTGFDIGPNGQVSFVRALARILKDLPNKNGIGIFWWAAKYQVNKRFPFLAGFERRSFFNITGYPLPIIREFGRLVDGSISISWFFGGIMCCIIVAFIFMKRSACHYREQIYWDVMRQMIQFWKRRT